MVCFWHLRSYPLAGAALFLLSLAISAYGMRPFKQANQAQIQIRTLILTNEHLNYEHPVRSLQITLASLKSITYYQTSSQYGALITLKSNQTYKLPFFDKEAVKVIAQAFTLTLRAQSPS